MLVGIAPPLSAQTTSRYPPTVRHTVDFGNLFEEPPKGYRVRRFDELESEPALSVIEPESDQDEPASAKPIPESQPPFEHTVLDFDDSKSGGPTGNSGITQPHTSQTASALPTTSRPPYDGRASRMARLPALNVPVAANSASAKLPLSQAEVNGSAPHDLSAPAVAAHASDLSSQDALPNPPEVLHTTVAPLQTPIHQSTTIPISRPNYAFSEATDPTDSDATEFIADERFVDASPQSNSLQLTGSEPWWEREVNTGLRPTQQQLPISLNSLLVSALANSAQIQLISDAPLISETEITAADAAFDWTSFVDARWDDISEPVGSTLTTGGPDRLRDHNATVEMGMRRRNTIGGEFEIGQRFGHQNNNSIFFIPQNQGSSQLTLSYTQPLLRGAGRVYNTSLTVLAQLRTKLSRKEFEAQLQDHLLSITREYWTLYFERSRYLQHKRLLANGERILKELKSREEIDALQSQIVRAHAAVENRRSQLVRSRLAIRMAEARIRALVNDPALGNTMNVELVPQEHLLRTAFPVDLNSAVSVALQSRPEIEAAIQEVKSASVRMNMGKREALPLLNVVLETYASGLEGNSNVSRAFREQFTEGEPSYGIGLQYEYPIWNRAASSRVQQRRLELRRLQHQFRQTVESMKLEVELAVHQVHAAYESLGAKQSAMEAANKEVAYLYDRWLLLPIDNGSASLLLEDLLEAQDRLAESELGLLQASLDHSLSQVDFKRAVGSLLENHQVAIDRNCNCNLPQQQPVQTQPLQFLPASTEALPSYVESRESTFEVPIDAAAGPSWDDSSYSELSAPQQTTTLPPAQTRPIWNDSPITTSAFPSHTESPPSLPSP